MSSKHKLNLFSINVEVPVTVTRPTRISESKISTSTHLEEESSLQEINGREIKRGEEEESRNNRILGTATMSGSEYDCDSSPFETETGADEAEKQQQLELRLLDSNQSYQDSHYGQQQHSHPHSPTTQQQHPQHPQQQQRLLCNGTSSSSPSPTFDVAVPQCPATSERPQALTLIPSEIDKPSIARANLAVSTDHPSGSTEYSRKFQEYTVLQQHVLFWDRDGDGEIWPWHTYVGFRELGFSMLFSLAAMVIIHVNFSYPTRLACSIVPDPWFRVYVGGIHKAKHGSDSGVYDREGRFVPQAFEDLFTRWTTSGTGNGKEDGLSARQLWDMIRGHRLAGDPFGWGAAFFEFGTAWLLLQKDGRVSKEDLRQTYDGSIFWKIRERRLSGQGWDKGFGIRDLVGLVLSRAAVIIA